MNIHYKGFVGKIVFSSITDTFYGEVLNCENLIAFQGESLETTVLAMKVAIDQHISEEEGMDFC